MEGLVQPSGDAGQWVVDDRQYFVDNPDKRFRFRRMADGELPGFLLGSPELSKLLKRKKPGFFLRVLVVTVPGIGGRSRMPLIPVGLNRYITFKPGASPLQPHMSDGSTMELHKRDLPALAEETLRTISNVQVATPENLSPVAAGDVCFLCEGAFQHLDVTCEFRHRSEMWNYAVHAKCLLGADEAKTRNCSVTGTGIYIDGGEVGSEQGLEGAKQALLKLHKSLVKAGLIHSKVHPVGDELH